MKKLFTFLLIFTVIGLTQIVEAQSQRMVFVEEATQASCPPCFAQNPPLIALVESNNDKVIFLAYQVWWPGYDAMYLDNEAEVDERIGNYYPTVTGAPNVVVQGSSGGQSVSYLNQTLIDNIYADMSEFDIVLDAEIDNGQLNISGTVTATQMVSGDLRLRLIISEELIVNADLVQIGTNGETEFHHVFKKFVNGPAGIDLQDSWAVNDTYTIDETFDLGTLNIYHYSEVEVMAIVQNDDNKFVHQAAKVHDLAITVSTDINVTARDITNLPVALCSGEQTISPVVNIQNSGNDTLTSLEINYDVNGGASETYNWTGSLSTLANENVTLPAYDFTASSTNVVNVALSSPNGDVDEDPSDNLTDATIDGATSLGYQLTMTLNTDCWPEENTWELLDGSGSVVESGGPYALVESEIVETFDLPMPTDCYDFVFFDSYGDGLHGSQWSDCSTDGNLKVEDGDGNVGFWYDGSYDAPTETQTFEAGAPVSVKENVLNAEFSIAPNPANDYTTLTFTLTDKQETIVRVLSLTGQEVFVKDLGLLGAGDYQEELLLGDLNVGVYFINLISGESTGIQKVTIAR